ncbi:MAG: ABC transporter ATP-binding protein [Algicola sp.]|nr:ABC transporter ATP-binding protein [Algicola sp.]
MSVQPVLTLDSVSKAFKCGDNMVNVLKNVNLTVNSGEYVGIEGPSGSGKSTLLSLLGLMDIPTDGALSILGKRTESLDYNARAKIRNQHIGFVFQSFNLIDEHSVLENVMLPLRYSDKQQKVEAKQWCEFLIEKVGLKDKAGFLPYQLSGGQQQRVAFARALSNKPTMILADEPTGNLDSANGESIMNLLQEENDNGCSIMLVTHDHRFAKCASRRLSLFDGELQ